MAEVEKFFKIKNAETQVQAAVASVSATQGQANDLAAILNATPIVIETNDYDNCNAELFNLDDLESE